MSNPTHNDNGTDAHVATVPSDHLLPAPGTDFARGAPQHAGHEEGPKLDLKPLGTGVILLLALAFAALLGLMFLIGYLPDLHRRELVDGEAKAAADSRPVVAATRPYLAKQEPDLRLPAAARAYQTTSIYPRANGFLKTLKVDIGDRVQAGQLLAELDIPDVDAQLAQSKAQLDNAKAARISAKDAFDLAEATYNRYKSIFQTNAITRQELDEKTTAYYQAKSALTSADATIRSSQADIDRLQTLVGFAKIYAPFSGVISVRNYDLGALLSSTGTTELFQIEETDVLRVYVDVPYAYTEAVKVGNTAEFTVRNLPNHPFVGKVARTAGSVDPVTRTMRVEADIPNPDALLLPGVYGEVRFGLGKRQASLMIPTSAMIFGPEGTQVAKIGEDNKISFQKIVVGRDLGQEIEVTSGLTVEDRIVANPGERLGNGMEVQVAEKKTVDKRDAPVTAPAGGTSAGGTPAGGTPPPDAAKNSSSTASGR